MTEPLPDKTTKKLKVLESNLNTIFPAQIITHYTSQERFSHLTAWGENQNFTTYFRLLLTDFIDESVEHVLYLDSDILVMCDIRELWDVDFEGNTALVVKSIGTPNKERIAEIGFKNMDKYFNAGVMMINMKGWEKLPLENIFSINSNMQDQDFLNHIIDGKVKILPFAWNMQWIDKSGLVFDKISLEKYKILSTISEKEFDEATKNPKILHFLFYKPWHTKNWRKGIPTVHPYAKEWMRVARMTPFGSEIYGNYIKEAIKTTISLSLQKYMPLVYG
ncbi:glycosyltransferase family 8 protein, partial [Helicobacter sp. CLO-3]|uniref:glycosyltransferase family 8 protein n=1 Tax=Helicobacter sp. CLO-3 TaxID=211 RepID=UPI00264656A8